MTDTPPPYDEEIDTILDDFGHAVVDIREGSRATLKRMPKAQLQALILRAQIAELVRHIREHTIEDFADNFSEEQHFGGMSLDELIAHGYVTPLEEARLAALQQQLKEVERKDK